jgi:hypothetical protein
VSERGHHWKGGRIVEPRGYVLLWRPEHPDADVRGYIYEHRLVAEEMLGRRLLPGEEVHHGPGGKGDNRRENLTVYPSCLAHREQHRKPGSRRRRHGQPNELVTCECGCGALFLEFDAEGRPRRYISGHNQQPAPSQDAVRAALTSGPHGHDTLRALTGLSKSNLTNALHRLARKGAIVRVGCGLYALPEVQDGG